MKEQASSVAAEIVSESVEHEAQNPPKKLLDPHDAAASSDEDSGFLNASNASLETCVDRQNPNDDVIETDERPETLAWKLKIPPKPEDITEEQIVELLKLTFQELESLPNEQKSEWMLEKMTEAFGKALPKSLVEIISSYVFDGDSGTSMDKKPEWLDMEKFRRGQKFACDHLFGMNYSQLISLFTVFSFEDGLKPIIATNNSSTPYTSFQRYLSTGSRIQNWYTSDPWTPGTPAYNDMKAVRRLHAIVRRKMQGMSDEELENKTTIKDAWCPALDMTRRDFQSSCPAPAAGQCPYMVLNKFPSLKDKKLNQGEMAATQFAFVGLMILNPKFFGVHYATDEDLEAFCHVWRGFGYLLGIEDDFNFCRGSLKDVQTRSRDFLEYWVKPNLRTIAPEWEHMMRCMIEGVQYYFPGCTYDTCLLDFAENMNLHMPRLYNSLPYSLWIKHNVIRFYFDYGSKLSALRSLMNYRLKQSLDKAKKFDEAKHKELKEKSAKTMESHLMELKKKKTGRETGAVVN